MNKNYVQDITLKKQCNKKDIWSGRDLNKTAYSNKYEWKRDMCQWDTNPTKSAENISSSPVVVFSVHCFKLCCNFGFSLIIVFNLLKGRCQYFWKRGYFFHRTEEIKRLNICLGWFYFVKLHIYQSKGSSSYTPPMNQRAL